MKFFLSPISKIQKLTALFLLCWTMWVPATSKAEDNFEPTKPHRWNIGAFGSNAFVDRDYFDSGEGIAPKNPGFAIEGGFRASRFWGFALRTSHHRLLEVDSHWTQVQLITDIHFLKPSSKVDVYLGAGLGYSRALGGNALDLSLRLGTDIWVTQHLAVSLVGTLSGDFGERPNSSGDDPLPFPMGGPSTSLGIRYRF